METVFVLLMMTVGLSHAIETHCDARQNGTQCYGALGGIVGLRLVEKTETRHEYWWRQINRFEIFRVKRNTVLIMGALYRYRSSFNVISGTFKMSDVNRSDEAHYVLTTYDISGRIIETKHLHLSVQAPVSRPKLSSECLSQGHMRVSCSCEGDSVQYSWTLDGQTLMDKQLLSGHHDTNNITLPLGTSGILMCDVNNSVSSDVAFEDISPCPGFKFINCTSSGTQISGWVFDNDTSCTTEITTETTTPPGESSSLDHSVYVYFHVAEVCVLLVVCVGFYIYYKMKTRPPPKQDPLYCNMVVMETQ